MSSPVTKGRVSPFQWNAGAWFGSQLGGTLWMLLGAGVLLPVAPGVGLVWLASFVLASALGLTLWARRSRWGMYAALQVLLLGLAVLSCVSMAAADGGGQLPMLTGSSHHPRLKAYGALLVFPALMALFHFRERSGGSEQSRPR